MVVLALRTENKKKQCGWPPAHTHTHPPTHTHTPIHLHTHKHTHTHTHSDMGPLFRFRVLFLLSCVSFVYWTRSAVPFVLILLAEPSDSGKPLRSSDVEGHGEDEPERERERERDNRVKASSAQQRWTWEL